MPIRRSTTPSVSKTERMESEAAGRKKRTPKWKTNRKQQNQSETTETERKAKKPNGLTGNRTKSKKANGSKKTMILILILILMVI